MYMVGECLRCEDWDMFFFVIWDFRLTSSVWFAQVVIGDIGGQCRVRHAESTWCHQCQVERFLEYAEVEAFENFHPISPSDCLHRSWRLRLKVRNMRGWTAISKNDLHLFWPSWWFRDDQACCCLPTMIRVCCLVEQTTSTFKNSMYFQDVVYGVYGSNLLIVISLFIFQLSSFDLISIQAPSNLISIPKHQPPGSAKASSLCWRRWRRCWKGQGHLWEMLVAVGGCASSPFIGDKNRWLIV